MEASASETRLKAPKRLIVKDPFLGRSRLRKEFVPVEEDAAPTLNSRLWSRLPEEVLPLIFARLPVKDILRMRSLSKTWRSCITSPHFQAAFEEASLVRIALMVHDKVDGTMFLTQDDGQECFRPGIARSPEVASITSVTATVNGLVCLIEMNRRIGLAKLVIRVFVMNVVTGVRRDLPHPGDVPTVPSFVRMDPLQEGGYTILFIYYVAGRLSWQSYHSVQNRWSPIEEARLGSSPPDYDREVFNMHLAPSPSFYESVAAFYPHPGRVFCIQDLNARHGDFCDGEYIAHAVHNVTGDLYKLCARGGQHGVWKQLLSAAETWELVCACPELEGTWTCLRVINDVVVLLFKLPFHRQPDAQIFGLLGIDVGTIVKVFHMPTKSWHNFPEKEYVLHNWGVSIRKHYAGPFLAELKFDVLP